MSVGLRTKRSLPLMKAATLSHRCRQTSKPISRAGNGWYLVDRYGTLMPGQPTSLEGRDAVISEITRDEQGGVLAFLDNMLRTSV